MQTIPDPDSKDKIGFLQSVLGHKVFSKKYTMFGGNLRITFRTLAIREIDILYQAAFQAQKDERILTTTDYYEYLNRLRLHLQLTSFSAKTASLHIKLPEGLSRDTHEGCSSYWDEFLEKEAILDKDKPLIQQVSDYVIDKVMKTEHLQRTITHECSKFNRLVAKLEASVDNPDFWERDRAAVLTLRSAVRGVVDYSKADLHNPSWWRHWRFLIRAMDEAEHGELLNRAFEYQLALVSNPRTEF